MKPCWSPFVPQRRPTSQQQIVDDAFGAGARAAWLALDQVQLDAFGIGRRRLTVDVRGDEPMD
jgi:hypothetical protein